MRLPGEIDGRRFLRAMGRFGWKVVSQRGSHPKLVHPDRPSFLIVAFHDTVRRGSVRATLRKAGTTEDEFLREL